MVEEFIETINSIPELMEAINNIIKTPYGWFILLGILVWVAFNKNILFFVKLREEKESKKSEEIEKYLSNKDNVDELTEKVLGEIRTTRIFKVATGIYAEKKRRDALINLYNNSSSNITWISIRRANAYIKVAEDNSVTIDEPTLLQQLGRYYNIIVCWFFLFFAVASLLLVATQSDKGILHFIFFLVLMCLSIGVAIFSIAQNLPLDSAIKIRKEINYRSGLKAD